VAAGRPQLELGVPGAAQRDEDVLAAVVHLEPGDWLRVAAVEAFRDAQHRGEGLDRSPQGSGQLRVLLVRALRRAAAVVARDERDHLDLVGMKSAQVAVLNEVVGMLVMARVADVAADVVHQRGIFEPLALPIREAVHRARLVEERQRQPHDLI
jgi:hypothetical protein